MESQTTPNYLYLHQENTLSHRSVAIRKQSNTEIEHPKSHPLVKERLNIYISI